MLNLLLVYVFCITTVAASNLGNPIDPENGKEKSNTSSSNIAGGIDIHRLPRAGQDAFWAHHPDLSGQKILLVPSNHMMNLRFISKPLQHVIKKEGEILITESMNFVDSWHDGQEFANTIHPYIQRFKEKNLIRNSGPFICNSAPWTEHLRDVDSKAFAYLSKEIQPFIEDIPLSYFSPDIVLEILGCIVSCKERFRSFGMDSQSVRHYSLQKKPFYVLEDEPNLFDEGFLMLLVESAELPYSSLKNLQDRIHTLIQFSTKYTPANAVHADVTETREKFEMNVSAEAVLGTKNYQKTKVRNAGWVPEFKKIVWENPNKFIVAELGSFHFPWDIGLFKLLSDDNFTFTLFDPQTIQMPIIRPFKSITPQTDAQKKITTAQTRQPAIQKNWRLATFQVECATPQLPLVKTDPSVPSMLPAELQQAELINAMARLFTLKPTEDLEKNIELLKDYVNTRNSIFIDTKMKDKKAALEILERHPDFNINQVSSLYHKAPGQPQ
jgi:hypothetical protein